MKIDRFTRWLPGTQAITLIGNSHRKRIVNDLQLLIISSTDHRAPLISSTDLVALQAPDVHAGARLDPVDERRHIRVHTRYTFRSTVDAP